jgi:hypothetical protein
MFLLAQSTATFPEQLWQLATPLNVMWYVYALAGIGFYGGYEYWRFFGRALYWLVFPIHAAIFMVCRMVLNYIRLAGADTRYVTTPCIFLFVWGLATMLMWPVGLFVGLIGASIMAYYHWTTGKW